MTAECLSVMGEERVRHTITYSGFSWRIKTNGGAFLALALLFTLSSWLTGWLPQSRPSSSLAYHPRALTVYTATLPTCLNRSSGSLVSSLLKPRMGISLLALLLAYLPRSPTLPRSSTNPPLHAACSTHPAFSI